MMEAVELKEKANEWGIFYSQGRGGIAGLLDNVKLFLWDKVGIRGEH